MWAERIAGVIGPILLAFAGVIVALRNIAFLAVRCINPSGNPYGALLEGYWMLDREALGKYPQLKQIFNFDSVLRANFKAMEPGALTVAPFSRCGLWLDSCCHTPTNHVPTFS